MTDLADLRLLAKSHEHRGDDCGQLARAVLNVIGPNTLKPIAWADKIAFEGAMRSGKGCDVWPSRGTNPTRALIALAIVEEQQE